MLLFDYILQGSDATEEGAMMIPSSGILQEVEVSEEEVSRFYLDYIGTREGVNVYYDVRGCYYIFEDNEE